MAYGSEIVLGWHGIDAVKDAAARLGIRFRSLHDVGDEVGLLPPDRLVDDLPFEIVLPNKHMATTSHRAAMAGMGWTIKGMTKEPHPTFIVETPFGLREAFPWSIQLQYDVDEMGDDYSTITLGIHLSARYFPCFLDMESEHGTLANTIAFTGETMRRIAVARSAILVDMPAFSDAYILVREIHY